MNSAEEKAPQKAKWIYECIREDTPTLIDEDIRKIALYQTKGAQIINEAELKNCDADSDGYEDLLGVQFMLLCVIRMFEHDEWKSKIFSGN